MAHVATQLISLSMALVVLAGCAAHGNDDSSSSDLTATQTSTTFPSSSNNSAPMVDQLPLWRVAKVFDRKLGPQPAWAEGYLGENCVGLGGKTRVIALSGTANATWNEEPGGSPALRLVLRGGHNGTYFATGDYAASPASVAFTDIDSPDDAAFYFVPQEPGPVYAVNQAVRLEINVTYRASEEATFAPASCGTGTPLQG